MKEIKAVIFDIDGTLTTRNSWNYLVEFLGVSPEMERQNFLDWKEGRINSEEADRKILEMWKMNGRGNKREFTKAFETIPLRPDALDLVNYLKSLGKELCLITGAMDMYSEIIAQRLGVEYYYGNAILKWNEKDEIEAFDYNENQSQKKVEQFNEFCHKLRLEPQECVPIGDSDNDSGLFELTGNGIAVKTEYEAKELESLAWKVASNLAEIKEIIK